MRKVALVLGAFFSCSAPSKPPTRWADQAPTLEVLAPRAEIDVTAKVAEDYSETREPLSQGPSADAVFARLLDVQGDVVRDSRLDLVAADLSTLVHRDAAISKGAIAFALHSHGLIEPTAEVCQAPRKLTPSRH